MFALSRSVHSLITEESETLRKQDNLRISSQKSPSTTKAIRASRATETAEENASVEHTSSRGTSPRGPSAHEGLQRLRHTFDSGFENAMIDVAQDMGHRLINEVLGSFVVPSATEEEKAQDEEKRQPLSLDAMIIRKPTETAKLPTPADLERAQEEKAHELCFDRLSVNLPAVWSHHRRVTPFPWDLMTHEPNVLEPSHSSTSSPHKPRNEDPNSPIEANNEVNVPNRVSSTRVLTPKTAKKRVTFLDSVRWLKEDHTEGIEPLSPPIISRVEPLSLSPHTIESTWELYHHAMDSEREEENRIARHPKSVETIGKGMRRISRLMMSEAPPGQQQKREREHSTIDTEAQHHQPKRPKH